MHKLFFLLTIIILSGCATISVDKTKDGDCKVVYSSLFKDLQNVTGNVCGGTVAVSSSAIQIDSAINLLNAVK